MAVTRWLPTEVTTWVENEKNGWHDVCLEGRKGSERKEVLRASLTFSRRIAIHARYLVPVLRDRPRKELVMAWNNQLPTKE